MQRDRSVMKASIVHFTHPGHLLTEVYGSEEFHCNGCEIPGFGPRYRCHDCDFNMHKFCGVCPSTLSTFMHPQHPLKLMTRDYNRRICDLCGDDVEGLFYQCRACDFNIHPLCTTLREDVFHHPLHPTCPLKLHKTTSSGRWCRVCKSEYCTSSSSWIYGCRFCGFDIHLESILAPADKLTKSRSVEALPPPPPWPYGFAPPPPPPIPWGVYPHYNAYGSSYNTHYPSIPPMCNWPPFSPFSGYAYHPPPPPPPSFVMPPSSSGFYSQGYATDFGPSFVGPPPSSGSYSHGGVGPHSTNNQGHGAGGQPSKWKVSRIISALMGSLSMGVLSNLIAGGITG